MPVAVATERDPPTGTTGILPVAVMPDWESRHLGGDPAASTSFRYGEGSERAAKLFGATMVG